ncbi:hypothetical protein [Thioalkalivibrio sp. HK1]|uniref:hypothetical protein n=1 Tax=Thioalkalivibrio sp. HK1 TaxID=1469245 RepID=UPI0004725140|nr:hypothetical protein [Thioalkalivibrio sp. HK1]
MSELDGAKAEWREKRLDRIEALLDSIGAKIERNADLIAESTRKNADLIAESTRENSALIGENRKSIAENAKAIAKNAEGIAELKEVMKWMPLKSGLWTVGIIISAIVGAAAIPDAAAFIMKIFGGE